jgi:hypothetical protein
MKISDVQIETLFELEQRLCSLADGISWLPDLSGVSQMEESKILRNVAASCATVVHDLWRELLAANNAASAKEGA